ncbi:MAG: HU family DNA-binding protein [Deltaproteobacteria bacterium]|jgi:DNA-binding protein HU-beta|nr:HU family DNA-binding protein [Deltaproteobacteria bacterium]
MTKAELIEQLQKGAGKELSKKELTALLDEVFVSIAKSVKKDKRFAYPGFGTFSLRKRAARVGRNPRTGVEIKIAASRTIAFKPAPNLKSSL